MSAALRLHLRIHDVQGVWFREATRLEAERLGVRGWVRNCPDGSVEAVLEGDEPAVRELEAWCAKGPPSARARSGFRCAARDGREGLSRETLSRAKRGSPTSSEVRPRHKGVPG